jgi:hypothetical protein
MSQAIETIRVPRRDMMRIDRLIERKKHVCPISGQVDWEESTASMWHRYVHEKIEPATLRTMLKMWECGLYTVDGWAITLVTYDIFDQDEYVWELHVRNYKTNQEWNGARYAR